MNDKRVPVEPAEEMIDAVKLFLSQNGYLTHPAVRAWRGTENGDTKAVWMRDYYIALCKAMLAAAPAQSVSEEQVGWALIGTWAGKHYVCEVRRVDEGQSERLHHAIYLRAALAQQGQQTGRHDAKRDDDGHCTVCGIEWPDERLTLEPHICPPGFLDNRTAAQQATGIPALQECPANPASGERPAQSAASAAPAYEIIEIREAMHVLGARDGETLLQTAHRVAKAAGQSVTDGGDHRVSVRVEAVADEARIGPLRAGSDAEQVSAPAAPDVAGLIGMLRTYPPASLRYAETLWMRCQKAAAALESLAHQVSIRDNCLRGQINETRIAAERAEAAERKLATAQAAERKRCAELCHRIAMAAFAEREKQQNGDFDHCSISEETGRYVAAEECEREIRALGPAADDVRGDGQ